MGLKLPTLSITILTLTEAKDRSVIEYELRDEPDADALAHVVEIIEWTGDQIREARVFEA
ncbi:MAG TPA: hypothetical protein EYQ81_05220 [Sneathiellales bacterium]|nr:hypothetical protein [Sneathiellales bacterium]